MTDIDFEELDKAVNTLMSGVDTSKRLPGADDPAENVVSIEPSGVSPTQPLVGTGTPGIADATNASAASSVPLATKRRGQFMDIMAPATKPATTPVSRQAPTLQPTTTPPMVEPTPRDATEFAEQPTEPAMSSSETPASAPVSTSAMPDVLSIDMESTGAAVVPEAASTTQSATDTDSSQLEQSQSTSEDSFAPDHMIVSAEPIVSSAANEDIPTAHDEQPESNSEPEPELPPVHTFDQPLESPFLPDAKVDKRPLGASPAVMPDPIDTLPPDVPQDTQDKPTEDPTSTNADTSVDGARSEEEARIDESAEQQQSEPLPETIDEQLAKTDTDTTSQSAAGGSIAQQYAEQPSSGDQTSGAIYDTATYHKAVDAPVAHKKHSVLTWLIWVLVLIAIGAAGGAGYFYFLR